MGAWSHSSNADLMTIVRAHGYAINPNALGPSIHHYSPNRDQYYSRYCDLSSNNIHTTLPSLFTPLGPSANHYSRNWDLPPINIYETGTFRPYYPRNHDSIYGKVCRIVGGMNSTKLEMRWWFYHRTYFLVLSANENISRYRVKSYWLSLMSTNGYDKRMSILIRQRRAFNGDLINYRWS